MPPEAARGGGQNPETRGWEYLERVKRNFVKVGKSDDKIEGGLSEFDNF